MQKIFSSDSQDVDQLNNGDESLLGSQSPSSSLFPGGLSSQDIHSALYVEQEDEQKQSKMQRKENVGKKEVAESGVADPDPEDLETDIEFEEQHEEEDEGNKNKQLQQQIQEAQLQQEKEEQSDGEKEQPEKAKPPADHQKTVFTLTGKNLVVCRNAPKGNSLPSIPIVIDIEHGQLTTNDPTAPNPTYNQTNRYLLHKSGDKWKLAGYVVFVGGTDTNEKIVAFRQPQDETGEMSLIYRQPCQLAGAFEAVGQEEYKRRMLKQPPTYFAPGSGFTQGAIKWLIQKSHYDPTKTAVQPPPSSKRKRQRAEPGPLVKTPPKRGLSKVVCKHPDCADKGHDFGNKGALATHTKNKHGPKTPCPNCSLPITPLQRHKCNEKPEPTKVDAKAIENAVGNALAKHLKAELTEIKKSLAVGSSLKDANFKACELDHEVFKFATIQQQRVEEHKANADKQQAQLDMVSDIYKAQIDTMTKREREKDKFALDLLAVHSGGTVKQSPMERLGVLAKLLNDGLISQDDFEEKKKQVLAEL